VAYPTTATTAVAATRVFRDRDGSLMSEVAYRIAESDQDREQSQSHDGDEQSVFGQGRSRFTGSKPPEELSHGAVHGAETSRNQTRKKGWRIIEGAGNMPSAATCARQGSINLSATALQAGQEWDRAVSGGLVGWRGARSRTFCGRSG
jgi:hypothetical protein